ncbi:MAG TPA: AI-2E family transporter [Usitatibacter sp.]|nr:AI-2E family transporter [Usitatibacter sp.]
MQPSRLMRYTIASWILAAIVLYLVLELRLVAALLSGLLVFEMVHVLAPRIPLARGRVGRLWAVALLSAVIVIALAAALFTLIALFRSDNGGMAALVQKTADILDAARNKLPPWVLASLPTDPDALKEAVIAWFKEHAAELRGFGGEIGHAVAHVLIGMIIGGMVALHEALPAQRTGPLAAELVERVRRVGEAFRRVVFAQVRISALNTLFTAIYLLVGLRLAGIELPFAKTLVLVTFLAGLLPVVGNLISNTVILVVSLSVSLEAAIASLVFLLVIHKLEYFLNARIVGSRIHASPWELLLAMLVMEAAFGIPGLAVAPVYYAYLKDELVSRELI